MENRYRASHIILIPKFLDFSIPQFQIRNPKCAIRNPQSEIRNPKSEIVNAPITFRRLPGTPQ
jgi:hypothetical protein